MLILADLSETKFLNYFNIIDSYLKFIMEMEIQGKHT